MHCRDEIQMSGFPSIDCSKTIKMRTSDPEAGLLRYLDFSGLVLIVPVLYKLIYMGEVGLGWIESGWEGIRSTVCPRNSSLTPVYGLDFHTRRGYSREKFPSTLCPQKRASSRG